MREIPRRLLTATILIALIGGGGYGGYQFLNNKQAVKATTNFLHINMSKHSSNYIAGEKAGRSDYRNHKFTNANRILVTTLNHSRITDNQFLQGYRAFLKKANQQHSLISANELKNVNRFTNYYLNLKNPIQQIGLRKGFSLSNHHIPFAYRDSVPYARGFLYGDMHTADGSLHSIAYGYSDYQNEHGHVKLDKLTSKEASKAYQLGVEVSNTENKYAIAHPRTYEHRIFYKSKLDLRYVVIYDEVLENNCRVRPSFAKGLFTKYPLHKHVYFPVDAVSGKKNYLNGVILGKHDNDTTDQMTKDYITYTDNMYRLNPKKKIQKAFNKLYKVKELSSATGYGDHVSVYSIQLRSKKHNSHDLIYYVMPEGSEGYVPRT